MVLNNVDSKKLILLNYAFYITICTYTSLFTIDSIPGYGRTYTLFDFHRNIKKKNNQK